MSDLPGEVWFAKRIPPEDERKTYYHKSKNRLFQTERGAQQFMDANQSSEFELYVAKVEWKKKI